MTNIDAAQYVLLTQDLYDDPERRYKVIFFVPGQPEEHDCIIGAFSCEADAENEGKRFTESLQKIIDLIRS